MYANSCVAFEGKKGKSTEAVEKLTSDDVLCLNTYHS
jgi:hypothetical protein